MALARLTMKNLHQIRVNSFPYSSSPTTAAAASLLTCHGGSEVDMKRHLSTKAGIDKKVANETSDAKEIATSSKGKQFKSLFSLKPFKRGLWRSKKHESHFVPQLFELFPSGVGNAIIQVSENMNKIMDDLNMSPWSLSARVKEENDCYKLRFDVPGLRKEDLKIVVDDGVLIINGERSEEKREESDSDDESFSMYGYYHTKLVLPEDAKVNEVKAELKNGVLCVVVPKDENVPKKEVKEVQIQ